MQGHPSGPTTGVPGGATFGGTTVVQQAETQTVDGPLPSHRLHMGEIAPRGSGKIPEVQAHRAVHPPRDPEQINVQGPHRYEVQQDPHEG